jgi:hypothetical protein
MAGAFDIAPAAFIAPAGEGNPPPGIGEEVVDPDAGHLL